MEKSQLMSNKAHFEKVFSKKASWLPSDVESSHVVLQDYRVSYTSSMFRWKWRKNVE